MTKPGCGLESECGTEKNFRALMRSFWAPISNPGSTPGSGVDPGQCPGGPLPPIGEDYVFLFFKQIVPSKWLDPLFMKKIAAGHPF